MFIHVERAVFENGYRLRLTFNDGAVKTIDLTRELDGPVFEPLRDPKLFRQVAVNLATGTIEWPNGADMAPEFLYEIGKPVAVAPTRRVAEGRSGYETSKTRPRP
jgi:hypothetical protein